MFDRWYRLLLLEDVLVLQDGRDQYVLPAVTTRDRHGTLFVADEAQKRLYQLPCNWCWKGERPGKDADKLVMEALERAGVFLKFVGPSIEVLVSRHQPEMERMRRLLLDCGCRKVKVVFRADLVCAPDCLVVDVEQAFTEISLYQGGRCRKSRVFAAAGRNLDQGIIRIVQAESRCLLHEVDALALHGLWRPDRTFSVNLLDRHACLEARPVDGSLLAPAFRSLYEEILQGVRSFDPVPCIVLTGSLCGLHGLDAFLEQETGVRVTRRRYLE